MAPAWAGRARPRGRHGPGPEPEGGSAGTGLRDSVGGARPASQYRSRRVARVAAQLVSLCRTPSKSSYMAWSHSSRAR